MSDSHRRIHSPAALPDLWLPAANNSSPATVQGHQSSTRPSLVSINVASPPSKSALLLTPPLTPASTRATDSDTSDARSSRSNSVDVQESLLSFHPYSQAKHFPADPSQWTSTQYHAMHAPSQGDERDFRIVPDSDHPHLPGLPSPTSPTRPRHPPATHDAEQEPTRFLFVTGVPTYINSAALKEAFVECGHLKGIYVRFQVDHGAVILAFYDLRHAIRAHRQISSRLFFDNKQLESRFISSEELRKLIGQSSVVGQNDGQILVSTSFASPDGELDTGALQTVLASFGDLRSFTPTDSQCRNFHIEYFDARDALSAVTALNGRVILGVRLHLDVREEIAISPLRVSDVLSFPSTEPPASQPIVAIPFPSKESPIIDRHPSLEDSSREYESTRPTLTHSLSEQNLRGRPRAHSISSPDPQHLDTQGLASYTFPPRPPSHGSPHDTPTPTPYPRVKTPPEHVHGRRISNIYHFDSVGRTMLELPRTLPPRPRSISVSSDTDSPIAGRLALPPSPNLNPPESEPLALPHSPLLDRAPGISSDLQYHPISPKANWLPLAQSYSTEYFPTSPRQVHAELAHGPRRLPGGPRHPRAGGGLGLDVSGGERERDVLPERNRIDIAKIERGEETRTTVMIKNIPNKMSDKNLIDFINDVCPRKVDFLYLRMDFTNGCNVGYAFVNFIHVEDLLHFAKTKLGTKWNLFSSEKVLGMSYANYQGKEALIDKFRSSSIMDQREAWRPKLFHSSGPNQGLPEEWPVPTHVRRKERSNLFPNELHQNRTLFHHHSQMRG